MKLAGKRLRRRLGVLLRQGREEAGLTQEAAAHRLRGFPTARTLYKWESGEGNLKPLHYAVWLASLSDTLRKGLVFLMQPDSDQRGVGGKVADALLEADIATATLEERHRGAKRRAERSTEHARREKARAQRSATRWRPFDEAAARFTVEKAGAEGDDCEDAPRDEWAKLSVEEREAEIRNAERRREAEMLDLAKRVARHKVPVGTIANLIEPYEWHVRGLRSGEGKKGGAVDE